MIEAPINEKARQGIQRAHQERGQALRDAWSWLFSPKGSR